MKIAFIGRVPLRFAETLQPELEQEHEVVAVASPSEAHVHEAFLKETEIVISPVLTPDLAGMLPGIRLFQAPMAGLDSVRLDLLPPHVVVANTFNHEVSIAEHVLMGMLVGSRRALESDRLLRDGRWEGSWLWGSLPEIRPLTGQTLLVVGTGRIGREVAKRARCFGMETHGVTRNSDRSIAEFDRLWSYGDLTEALPVADFVVIACPLTKETRGLIGEEEISAMRPTAHLTNIARGEIIEEEALWDALSRKKIASAAIDVWYQYPKSPDDQRWPSRFSFEKLDNVLLTPHSSGWTMHTVEGRIADIRENIRRFVAGEPVLNAIRRH